MYDTTLTLLHSDYSCHSLLIFNYSRLSLVPQLYLAVTIARLTTVILARLTIDSISLSFSLFFFLFGNYVALAFFLSSSSVFGPIISDKLLARSIPLRVATPHAQLLILYIFCQTVNGHRRCIMQVIYDH